ncbi:MAG: alpha/beta hydrolase [Anaerolineae bacterium]|nr:MAG: alpha/beta hydrolase [Anaerolineae bacterium]
MTHWQNYLLDKDPQQHTVLGNLQIKTNIYSPQLQNTRDVLVYLPPSYEWPEMNLRHYPVLYMQDGQNLFDAAISYAGEWQVDESIEMLAAEYGTDAELIVVGIPNNEQRQQEYNPFDHPRFGKGRGNDYLRFVVETVKPEIDRQFRTLPDRANTGIAGSSMGGLISLYGYFHRADVFGYTAVFSPALWAGMPRIQEFINGLSYIPGKIYLDVGTNEGSRRKTNMSISYLMYHARQVVESLVNKGYSLGDDLLYFEEDGGGHSEADWARRFPDALKFLLRLG